MQTAFEALLDALDSEGVIQGDNVKWFTLYINIVCIRNNGYYNVDKKV
jgi:hypothetical protein